MQTKFHVKYCGFDKIFMDKDLIEDKLQMTDQFMMEMNHENM